MVGYLQCVLDAIQSRAVKETTCTKTAVGAMLGNIVDNRFVPEVDGYNANYEYDCRERGCYRKKLFGTDSIETRPWCKAIHAEENAINEMIKRGLKCTTAVVTRYPCEKCAKLLIHHGIKHIIYGRPFKVSEETQRMLDEAGVKTTHIDTWNGDTNDRNQ